MRLYIKRSSSLPDWEAAVQLHIDGLSMFTFTEERFTEGPKRGTPRYSTVLVAPRSSFVIRGWHINNKQTDLFLVTEYAKSAVAGMKPTGKVGTISAAFQAAWDPKGKMPPDEPKRYYVKDDPGDATGRGDRIDQNFKEVRREVGLIRDNIVVRYTLEDKK